MRLLRRITAALGLTLLVLVLATFTLVWRAMPGGDATLAVAGLAAPVSIAIDTDGVPRIVAASRVDAAAALGVLHARERMFQMELMRRAAAGELAELVGPAALPLDRVMRTLGVRRSAERDLATLPQPVRVVLDAYAAGVNAWVAGRGRFVAAEFLPLGQPRPWTAVDCLLWGKTMGLYLSGNWRTELARLRLADRMSPVEIDALWPPAPGPGRPEARLDPSLAPLAARLADAVPAFPAPFTLPDSASNAWAVDGTHTATGAPLLAGDPHLGFGLPGIWYLARIDMGADGVLAGATAPGVPFMVIGHNGRIAWTFTTTGADTQDLFIETPSGRGYATKDAEQPFTIRSEVIHVRGGADVVLDVRETRHGPLINDLVDHERTQARGAPLLALSMAGLMDGDGAAAGLLALNQAGSVTQAGVAAAAITAPVQNLVVADRQGIGLFVTGRVPVRRSGDGARPQPGADGAHDWVGWASGDALPRIITPAGGRIVNANDRIAPPDFPTFLARDWFGDARARRIRALLDRGQLGGKRLTIDDFAAFQVDAVSITATDVLPRLRAVAPADTASARALSLLRDWDGSMDANRPEPLLFNAWMRGFGKLLLLARHVPDDAGAASAPGPDLIAAALGPGPCDGCDQLLARSLAEAVAALGTTYGDDPGAWRWGEAHRAVFPHPILGLLLPERLAGVWIDSPGDDSTIDRGGLAPDDFRSVHGAAFRGVYDLADLEASRFVIAPGQSGHFFSRLSSNFLRRWRDGGTIRLDRSPGSIDVRLELLPAPGDIRS